MEVNNRILQVEESVKSFCEINKSHNEVLTKEEIKLKDYIAMCLNPHYYRVEDINVELQDDDEQDEDLDDDEQDETETEE